MGLTINFKPTAPKPPYTILAAIAELAAGRKGTLMVERVENGDTFQVLKHDPETGLTSLAGPNKIKLRVKIGEREVPKYRPYWR